MSSRLSGRVAFITGAARGQGRAHAVRMAAEGSDLIAIDIAGKLPDVVPYDPTAPEDLAEAVRTWNTVMTGAQRIIDGDRGGSIILIGSAAGVKVQPFMVHYTDCKYAITGMARAFAAELGKHSIRVNSVHPGPVNTPMGSGDMVAGIARAAETNPQLTNMLTPFLPSWVAQPEDNADAVCSLANDESRNVTAPQISVDQGSTQY